MGEEFAIIAPILSAAQGHALAERIRSSVAETPFAITLPDGHESPLDLTVSIGLACLPEHARDAHGLFRAADAALYQAKILGRHRVAEAQPDQAVVSDQDAGSGRPASRRESFACAGRRPTVGLTQVLSVSGFQPNRQGRLPTLGSVGLGGRRQPNPRA
jgi:hypothetical protein